MSISELKNDLKSKKLRKVYLFFGPEDYLKKHYLDEIRKYVSDEFRNMNYNYFEGKVSPDDISDACDTPPVFSEKRVVVVKDSGIFKAKKSGKKASSSKDDADRLSEYMKKIPEEACLVFEEEEIDKKSPLIEAIQKNGLVVEFGYQKPEELAAWVQKIFRTYGKEINGHTAMSLIEQCDESMNHILGEVMKVVNYTGERKTITIQDIEKVSVKSLKGRVFDLVDAMAQGASAKALEILDDLIGMKESPILILYMIAKHYRSILSVKLLKDKGYNSSAIASETKLPPFVVGKYMKQTSKFSTSELKKILMDCFESDYAIKSGRMEDRTAIEIIISKYTKK